jgi:hypothetical protein
VLLSNGEVSQLPYILTRQRVRDSEPFLQRMAERRTMDQAVLAYLGVKLPWLEPEHAVSHSMLMMPERKEDVKLGGFCGGTFIETCGKDFGEALWIACRSCPN